MSRAVVDDTDERAEKALEPSQTTDDDTERGQWSNPIDFFLSCVGYAVGLGNVWRFPYLCYSNGGGAFLIPYVFMLVFAGLPLFLLELSFGQFASLGPITIWRAAPLFKGIGAAMIVISFLVCIYYNVVICYVFFYLFASFTSVLPWSSCGNQWNTEACQHEYYRTHNCTDVAQPNTTVVSNFTCVNGSWLDSTDSEAIRISNIKVIFPSEEYFKNRVLQQSDGLHDMTFVNWELALCLLLAWFVTFLCLVKGIKTVGKVVYLTSTFPYLVLVILLGKCLTLNGSMTGIMFYITPHFDKLLDPTVWKDAAAQIFYSLGTSWGTLIAFSSYSKFHNNCYRDAVLVTVINCLTSVFAGFVIFSIIGFMAHELDVDIDKVVQTGPGLAFIAYPEAVSRMPVSPLWSILFFVMLVMIGLDTQFAVVETIVTSIIDELPPGVRRWKTWITLAFCGGAFLLGLPLVTNGGIYLFNLMDTYSASFSLIILGFIECVVISWVYGWRRFVGDIYLMTNVNLSLYWKLCWCVITPVILMFIFVFNVVKYENPTYGEYEYSASAIVLGWIMVLSSFSMVPIVALFKLFYQTNAPITTEHVVQMLKPTKDWGPALLEHREEDKIYRPHLYQIYKTDPVLFGMTDSSTFLIKSRPSYHDDSESKL